MNIGILNAGGDCPGLNAVIEGAVAAASARGWKVYGFYDGFEGLLSTPGNERWRILTPENCLNIRSTGGTILGIKVLCLLFPALCAVGSWVVFRFVWNITPELKEKMAQRRAGC